MKKWMNYNPNKNITNKSKNQAWGKNRKRKQQKRESRQ